MNATTPTAPEASAETWFAERSTAGDTWNVLDENRLRVATVHRSGDGAHADACLLAAAPQLREKLAALVDWVEDNVAYGMPRGLLEDVSQALQDARPPL